MTKLIKMDFYRLFTGKAIKVGAIIACLVCAGYVLLSLGIVELAKLLFSSDPESVIGWGLFIPQAAWVGGVNFSQVVLGATGALALFIGCMITANFIGSEQSCGYTKNFAGQLPNKGYMAISKFIVSSAAQILVLFIYTVVSAILALLLFGQYINGYDIGGLFAALGIRVLLHLAVNAIIIFVCTLTKSHAIAMVVGSVFGIGITYFAYFAADMILGTLNIPFSIGDYMPDGINGRIGLDMPVGMVARAIIVALAFIVVFVAANYVITRRRDVK